ncbi:MAG: Flp pilus assembly complex ATPase component TadA [Phycisphaeraceae bacterium]|nr:Flp pilus assembly complex ATPase component TadA [Phycisphaeraceae bacterium]MCB9848271.1 Flp pilus assembly complex ATPase component TadA [Phycisphaeraceae bacterium]
MTYESLTTLATLAVEADPVFLVSWWKPALVAIPFIGWAWVVTSLYDADVRRFLLGVNVWNPVHVVMGLLALGMALLLPNFLIGYPAMLLLLGIDLGAYWFKRNASHKVPEDQKWSMDISRLKEQMRERKEEKLAKGVTLAFRGPEGTVKAPERGTPEYDVRIAAEALLIDAVGARASRIDIAPGQDGNYSVALTIDGVRRPADPIPGERALGIIDFLKSAGGLDVTDRRRKLRANIKIEQGGATRPLRLATSGSTGGVKMNILFDPEGQVNHKVEDLGLTPKQLDELRAILLQQEGVVLLSSPPANGRTATMYALAREHDAYTQNIQTLELEPSTSIEGVRQNVFDPMAGDGTEYATMLRSILRRDPDVVFVAELPDVATAQEIVRADQSRTRTFVSLRADSALAAVQTFAKAVGDSKKVADALTGVIAVRLVRKLCQNCRVEYTPQPEMLKKLGTTPERTKSLFKRGGQVLIRGKEDVCPVCQGSGYFGQEGVFEVFQVGAEERQPLANGDLMGFRNAIKRKRLPSIQEAAVLKALSGVTSVEEVARITSTGAKPKPGQQKPGQGAARPAAKP